MTQEIEVEVIECAFDRDLFAVYAEEDDLHNLYIIREPSGQLSQGFTLNFDDAFLLNVNADREIDDGIMMISRSHWAVEPTLKMPKPAPRGEIRFSTETVRRRHFEIPVEVSQTLDGATVHIRLGTLEWTSALALSGSVTALLRGSDLTGFILRLRSGKDVPD